MDNKMQAVSWSISSWLLAGAMVTGTVAVAQKQQTTATPATDSAAQASPVQTAPRVPATDAAADASPAIGPVARRGASIAAGTPIHVSLMRGIDSSSAKNGQHAAAILSAPLKTSAGVLPVGTPVVIDIVSTVPAGTLTAVGEFSLQVTRVGSVSTFTEIRTFRGLPGKREVADAAPTLGTNAGLAAGAAVDFEVSKPATAAVAPPKSGGTTPGSVDAVAPGSPGKATGGTNSGEPTYGDTKSVLTPATASH